MKKWKHKCLRSVLTYRPDPLRPDRVTVGFVLVDVEKGSARNEVRFSPDLTSLHCIAPDLEIEAVEAMLLEAEPELRSVLTNVTDIDQFNFLLSENIPDELEVLPPNPILTDDFDAELAAQADQLFRSIERDELAEQERKRGHYGRMYLQKKMRSAFNEFGVWERLHKKFAINKFMLKNDSFTVDCAYVDQQTNTLRMFDAVSLVTTLDRARILSLSWSKIREGIQESEQRDGELFAIVEDGLKKDQGRAKDAWSWMEDAGIRVSPVSSMPALAADARIALRL